MTPLSMCLIDPKPIRRNVFGWKWPYWLKALLGFV